MKPACHTLITVDLKVLQRFIERGAELTEILSNCKESPTKISSSRDTPRTIRKPISVQMNT